MDGRSGEASSLLGAGWFSSLPINSFHQPIRSTNFDNRSNNRSTNFDNRINHTGFCVLWPYLCSITTMKTATTTNITSITGTSTIPATTTLSATKTQVCIHTLWTRLMSQSLYYARLYNRPFSWLPQNCST